MLIRTVCFLAFIFCVNAASIFVNKPTTCGGYELCNKPDPKKLNIHIVAHSHDDVGWLKTVDQYYYGSRNIIQKAGVKYIIDSYIEALQKNPDRRFIQVETAFFWKWWRNQGNDAKNTIRQLVDSGRLEIIGGGWSMADEGTTHYHSLIDQYTWGFRRLSDSLGKCARPKIGWQIDPFGHSREQAAMFAQLGFDGYFFGRLDWMEKSRRFKNKTTEFIWKANPSLGKKADIFTGILYNTYMPPPGYCFDFLCADEPIIDDVTSPQYNVPKKVDDFLRYCEKMSTYYQTNNVLLTMGGDFTYQYAEMNFQNLDLLIKYANERNGSDFNMFYSTPSCYLKAVHEENIKWSVKTDDFFPYASDPHAYWTGYFTSRPTLKYFERLGNNYLQVVKQLAVAFPNERNDEYLEEFREAMGVMQHHDAVTGTEKQHVAEDYARILHKAFIDGDKVLDNSLKKLASDLEFKSCLQLNISSCEYTELNEKFAVTIYNPLSYQVSQYVRLPVTGNSYSIRDNLGTKIATQIVPIIKKVQTVPGRSSSATHDLVFEAVDIPPLGLKSYYVSKENNVAEEITFKEIETKPFSFDTANANIKIAMDELNSVSVQMKNVEGEVRPSIMYYEAAAGNNMVFENRSSGAYIFRPNVTHPENFNDSAPRAFMIKGPLVTEIYVERNDWITEVYRVYTKEEFVEYNWVVGPIPIEDGKGKEIIVRYNSTIGNTKGVFFTDSNGRQMLRRERRYSDKSTETGKENDTFCEPIAGNYYPIGNKIYIQNDETNVRLAILNDRSQGGSSLNDGQVEVMVHRRLLRDDAFGVEEALNETAYGEGLVTVGKHFIHFGNTKTSPDFIKREKKKTVQLALSPWIAFAPLDISFDEYQKKYKMEYSSLKKPLPENINILTLEPWKDGTMLLRLEHLYEVGESNQMSKPVEVNIKDMFAHLDVISITETMLGANQDINENDRLNWSAETENILETENQDPVVVDEEAINVVMKPSQIRTFIVKIK